MQGDEKADLRHNLKQRNIERNKKKIPKEHYRRAMEKWHSNLRERAIRTGAAGTDYDKTWGRFKSNFCFNIDQSPLSFARCNKDLRGGKIGSTLENLYKKTWMPQPNTGDNKKVLHLECMLSPIWITTEACYNL